MSGVVLILFLHDQLFDSYVSKSIVMVGSKNMDSHGTGFYVKVDSGLRYILTNGHVCEIAEKGIIYIKNQNMKSMPRRVMAISDKTDLCLIEGFGDNFGKVLSIKDVLNKYMKLTSYGYPKDLDIVITRGEVINPEISTIPELITSKKERDACNPEPFKLKINLFNQEFCITSTAAVNTTLAILQGDSGSPVVNFWGSVVGIVFATRTKDHDWGLMIPSYYIIEFLKDY